ncbi:MAG: prenyltransferase/squalene oxidase repeat-containing protein, partial [Pirellula sp.]
MQRRQFLAGAIAGGISLASGPKWIGKAQGSGLSVSDRNPKWESATRRGLDFLARTQSSRGQWNTPPYPVAVTALAGLALLCSGSTVTQGPYSKQIARTTDYLLSQSRKNGLIGDPQNDQRYTYGHGFSMLFLSQVLGEEGLQDRRDDLVEVLDRAVAFCGKAQTPAGGWGYVSAKDGQDYDEGSTTITQVQGLRGCRNAGISVPGEIIESAKKYIYSCQNPDGGISYSSQQMG